MSRIHSIFILALCWTAWCALHSFLLSGFVKTRIKNVMGRKYGYYRLAFSIFSILSLLPVIYFQLRLEERVLFAWPWPWSLIKYGMYAAALLFFYKGAQVYDLQYMLGLKQIQLMRQGKKEGPVYFTAKGILGYVRHPWYSGAILFVLAFGAITDVSLVSKTVLILYIIIGTLLEENRLISEIGEPYLTYREKVPMFIPWRLI